MRCFVCQWFYPSVRVLVAALISDVFLFGVSFDALSCVLLYFAGPSMSGFVFMCSTPGLSSFRTMLTIPH